MHSFVTSCGVQLKALVAGLQDVAALLTPARSVRLRGRWLWLMAVFISWSQLPAAEIVDGPFVRGVARTNAVITWATDVATKGVVRFGLSASSLTNVVEAEQVQAKHAVTLTGLRPGVRYQYVVSTARVSLATNSFVLPGLSEAAPVGVGRSVGGAGAEGGGARDDVRTSLPPRAPPTRATWGNLASLQDHFDRHGQDFKARDPDDYARQAWEFLQRARQEGLPAKVDEEGILRIFDPKSRAFAAYNRNGTTKTYFKPNSRDYFDRQPGNLVDARKLTFRP